MEETKKINYKSDFDFIVEVKATGTEDDKVAIDFPQYDWEIILTAGDCSYNSRTYIVSYHKGVATNCYNDNGKIHIICDNHKLPVGQLQMEFRSFLPNSNYPDGTQKVVATYELDIELTTENTGITSAEVQIVLPFLYDSAYNQAVKGGYKGTQEEYYQLASQLPNAVETANKVSKSADSLADSAEQIGGAIETLATTTDAIEQGANVIKDNADTLQASATIVKASAEQIGGSIADLKASVSSIDGAVDGINQGASTIATSATKVETSATTLEGVSTIISDSATSLSDSATAIAEGANTIKSSADTLQENADKVSESATKVEQSVEPLVQASESLDATKQAFEMLSSEWTDGRQAIATALTNRRYPTEPTESFHAMADKITNMSYEEGWFAKIGYTEGNNLVKKMVDYSYEAAKGWNPDGSTMQMFRGNKSLVFLPMIDTSNVTDMSNMFQNCSVLTTIPLIDTSSVSNISYMFFGCSALTTIPQLDTSNVVNMDSMFRECRALTTIPLLDTSNVTAMTSMFQNCSALTTIPQLDTSNVVNMSSVFGGCNVLSFMKITNLGKSKLATYDFSGASVWGTGSEENRQSLIDSLITYSYDRASNGMATATIKLSATTKALLTEEEIAQITNKGFTIS